MVACTGGFLEKEGGSAHSPGMRKMSEKLPRSCHHRTEGISSPEGFPGRRKAREKAEV